MAIAGRGRAARRSDDAWRNLREAVRRPDPGTVVRIGFSAGMAWAFVGSLGPGLGAGSASKVAAWSWLTGELLIGAAVCIALMLGTPTVSGDGT